MTHNFNVSAGRISALGLEPWVLKYRSSVVGVHTELIFFQCASTQGCLITDILHDITIDQEL